MRLKLKRKDWFFAGFISGLFLLIIWIIVLFTDMNDKSTWQKAGQWMMLFVFISNPITFYLGYKNELKKETELQKKDPGM